MISVFKGLRNGDKGAAPAKVPGAGAQGGAQRRLDILGRSASADRAATGVALDKNGLRAFSADGAALTELTTEEEILGFGLTFSAFDNNASRPHVAAFLAPHILPVRCAIPGREGAWLLATRDYCQSVELAEMAHDMAGRGLVLEKTFQVVVVTPTLLASISRGTASGRNAVLRGQSGEDRKGAALLQTFISIIDWAHENGAADVDFWLRHHSDRSSIRFSIAGKWVEPERFSMPTATMRDMIGVAYQYGKGASEGAIDFGLEQQLRLFLSLPKCGEEVMLRWAGMAGDDIYCVTTRISRRNAGKKGLTFDDLGYLDSQRKIWNRALRSDGGAIVLSGVVDSGKSTTLRAVLSQIPLTRKLVTIEDPVEDALPDAICNTIARSMAGTGSSILTSKLRVLKRTGFNDLFLGEIRDRETGQAMQDVLESGQKLWTTVHCASAWMIPSRLAGASIGVPREVISTPGMLRLLVNQALLPRSCPHCRLPFTSLLKGNEAGIWKPYAERLQRLYEVDLGTVMIRNPEGCEHCRRADLPELYGFNGRTNVSEMIEPDDDFLRLVAANDGLGLARHVRAMRGKVSFCEPDMTGKNAMECAVYKMTLGEIDPREIEPRFVSFEAVEMAQSANQSV